MYLIILIHKVINHKCHGTKQINRIISLPFQRQDFGLGPFPHKILNRPQRGFLMNTGPRMGHPKLLRSTYDRYE
jgi:hypothetical protein